MTQEQINHGQNLAREVHDQLGHALALCEMLTATTSFELTDQEIGQMVRLVAHSGTGALQLEEMIPQYAAAKDALKLIGDVLSLRINTLGFKPELVKASKAQTQERIERVQMIMADPATEPARDELAELQESLTELQEKLEDGERFPVGKLTKYNLTISKILVKLVFED